MVLNKIIPIVLLSAPALLIGCASTSQPQAEGPVLEAAIEKMLPVFECVLLYDQLDEREKVSETIDDASSIGEKDGLSPGQIMSAYGKAKRQASELVLEQAIQIASDDPDRLPRFDGSAPPPKPEDELQAWKDVYSSQCSDDETNAST